MPRKKRAPNSSGSVWRRKDGRYSAAITRPHYDAAGRTRRKRITTTRRTWEEAHRWLMERQRDLLAGVRVSSEEPLLRDYLATWLRDVVEPTVAPKTYEKREYHTRVHISPAFGGIRLKDLTPRQIHTFYAEMAMRENPLAASTRRDIHTTLKMALKQAVRWSLIPANPADIVDPPRGTKLEDEDEEIRALSDEQARSLFAATEGKRWRHYYVAAIRTGLRPGEMLGLRWGDLNLESDPGSLRVRRTLGIRQGGGTYTKRPKSDAGRRALALHWEASDAFAAQRGMISCEGLPTGPKDLVFPSTTGTPMSRHNLLYRNLKPDLARAGLPALSLHELRHTFASIMLYEWRVPREVVMQMLGHSSMRMTEDLYGHLMPGAQESAIRALRDLHKRPESDRRTGT